MCTNNLHFLINKTELERLPDLNFVKEVSRHTFIRKSVCRSDSFSLYTPRWAELIAKCVRISRFVYKK